ncbi:MAG: hypothetical protein OXG46_06090 [Chloroflexi bacterium]|nr:hypothetical protein [Chloroflexota bacterium]
MAQTEQDSRERTAQQADRGPRAARMSPQNVQATAAEAERTKNDGKWIVGIAVLSVVILVVILIGLFNDQPWAAFLWDLLGFLDSVVGDGQ